MPVGAVILEAYGLQMDQLIHDINPTFDQKVDIDAKTERSMSSGAQMHAMLQALLEERFKLAIHRESREMNALVVTLATDEQLGPNMKKSDRECEEVDGTISAATAPRTGPLPPGACGLTGSAVGGVGRIVGVGLDMAKIIDIIQAPNRFVVDQTGLKDRYNIDVTYTYFSPATLPRPNGPSLLTALKGQLGFNLQYKKMPLPVVVIDHIEPLTEN